MDFNQARRSNPFNRKEPPSREEPDSPQQFPDLYLSRPEKALFSGKEIKEALLLIFEKTGGQSLKEGMEIIWFKSLSKDEKAQVERIVSILRLAADGRITPPFDLHKAYLRISEPEGPISGPSR